MTAGAQISRALEDIATLLALSGENAFKVRAFERGARVVADLDADELPQLITSDKLTELDGIGPALAREIVEMWSTGSSALLAQLRGAHPPGAAELARVPGMTRRRMKILYEGLGIGTVEALAEACRAERLRVLPGFGPKTEQRLLAAVVRMQAPPEPGRILLSEAQRLAARIEKSLLDAGCARRVLLAGAARRFEETLGELELVVVDVSDEDRLWRRLLGLPWVTRIDRAGRSAQLSHGVPLQLHFATEADAGSTLLLATGPQPHVQALEARAAERGTSLPRAVDEDHCYGALGLPLVPPELRGSRDDLKPDGYADLLEATAIRGMVHCHTTYSDGKASIEEMALAAEALGYEYITITDHSPSAHYAGGVTLDRLKEQWDEIARVQERTRVRILRGAESDILADGALDYPDAVLEQFDVVIASIHTRFKQDRAQMTERLVRAMGLPLFKIWGHALGRMLLTRAPIECDVPAVLDALAQSRGAIEVNADPHRLDLPPEFIPAARDRGIPFVVSVDAHSTEGLKVLPLGVGIARRGGLRRHEVLNTLPAEEFAARVRPG